ncbi:TPA: phage baseplate assembly protein V [Neisseria gonorrhoeae]
MEACRKRQKPPRSAITGRFPTSRRDRNDRPPNRQPDQTRHHRRHRPRVRAQHGGITTDWLPYIVPFAGGVSVWRIPSVGEACTILSPVGEPENGVVLCCQASDRYPAPSADPAETVVRFPDGTHIRYNHNSGAMELKAVTSLTIDTPQTTITGHLTVNQTTTAQGLLTYQNGMNGQGGSLSEHTHPDDSGGTTEKPQ